MYDRALGGVREPGRGSGIRHIQRSGLSCVTDTAQGVKVTKLYNLVYGVGPIRVGSSEEADVSEMVRRLCAETDPAIRERIEFHHGSALPTRAEVQAKVFPLPKENPIKPLGRGRFF